MNKKRKEYIDSLWKNTELYEWILAVINEDETRAKEIKEALFNKGYFCMIEQLDDEISETISKEIKNVEEFYEYLKLLDKENSEMVGVIVSHNLFRKVDDMLK